MEIDRLEPQEEKTKIFVSIAEKKATVPTNAAAPKMKVLHPKDQETEKEKHHKVLIRKEPSKEIDKAVNQDHKSGQLTTMKKKPKTQE